jgi:hypothetical protein
MKKIILIACIIILGLQVTNAQKTNITTAKLTKNQVTAIYDGVGKIHNQALDYIYNSLVEQKDFINATLKTNDEKQTFLNNVIAKEDPKNPIIPILILTGTGPTYPNPKDNPLFTLINSTLNRVNLNSKLSISSKGASTLTDVTLQSANMSNEMLAFENELIILTQKNPTDFDLGNYENEINLYNQKVFNKFGINSNTTYALLASSYTALYSAKYWKENSQKWIDLKDMFTNTNSTVARSEACCGGVVTADAAGAVGGAITGGAAGAMGGTCTIPGVGTVAGAAGGAVVGAVVGGVANSAQQAVTNLLNWLF